MPSNNTPILAIALSIHIQIQTHRLYLLFYGLIGLLGIFMTMYDSIAFHIRTHTQTESSSVQHKYFGLYM